VAQPLAAPKEQNVPQEVKHRWIGGRIAALGPADRRLNNAAVTPLRLGLIGCDVGAVDREAGYYLTYRVAQAIDGEVAVAPVALRDAVEHVCEHIHFAGQRQAHDLLFAAVRQIREY